MKGPIRTALLLLIAMPGVLRADPLGNLGQIFPAGFILLSAPAALAVWCLVCLPERRRKILIGSGVVLAVMALILAVVSSQNSQAAADILFLLFFFFFIGIPLVAPFVLWCGLWLLIADWARRKYPDFPPALMIALGSFVMVAITLSGVWAIFPDECRRMFHM